MALISDKDKPMMARKPSGGIDDDSVSLYGSKPTRLVTKQKSADEKAAVKEPQPRADMSSSGKGKNKAPNSCPQNQSDLGGVNMTAGRQVDSKVGRVSDQDVKEGRKLVDPVSVSHEDNLRIDRAVRFLRHPSILLLSSLEKESYLRSKGLSDGEIETSKTVADEGIKGDVFNSSNMDGVWKNDYSHTSSKTFDRGALTSAKRDTFPHIEQPQNHANSHQEIHSGDYLHPSSYNRTKSENPELPNPLVPITIGGMIALFGLAALRWLNGGDFILFPPSTTTANNLTMDIGHDSSKSGLEQEQERGEVQNTNALICDVDTLSNAPSLGELEQTKDYNGSLLTEDGKPIEQCKEGVDHNNTCSIRNIQEASKSPAFQPNNLESDLPIELRNLTKAIETHSSIQERTLQHSLNEKAKNVTDTAMNLLRNHGASSPTAQGRDSPPTEGIIHSNKLLNNSLDLTILVQITEMKCALNTMKDEIKNTKSTEKKLNVQSVKGHAEGDKTDKETPEPFDAISDALEKLGKMSATLSQIESKLSWKSNPTRQKRLTDIKDKAINQKDETNSTTNTSKVTPEEQQTEPTDCCATSFSVSNHDNENQDLSSALNYVVKENTMEQVQSCAQMLYLYVMNLSSNPNLPRYQKVYTSNNSFKQKVESVKGAKHILTAVGFVDQGSYFEWKGKEIKPGSMGDNSVTILKQAAEALSLLKSGNQLNNDTIGVKAELSDSAINVAD